MASDIGSLLLQLGSQLHEVRAPQEAAGLRMLVPTG
jgi:hypothetical protein